jgi:copper chaperone NosL
MPPVRHFLLACLLGTPIPAGTPQTAPALPKPAARDLCPVCGMLVSKYPNWVATVVYKDGHAHHFDGAKDLFKYLLDPPKYAQGRQSGDIARIVVTEFYGLKKIDARKALFVLGSDVLGPMGHELVPMATQEDAEEFLRDHRGKHILRFDQVHREILAALDH